MAREGNVTDTSIIPTIAADIPRTDARKGNWLTGLVSAIAAALGATFAGYAEALSLAYAAPFLAPANDRKSGLDGDLNGRDPNW